MGKPAIHVVWAIPRSLSSAFERAMLERGDIAILHEPFSYLFYLGDKKVTDIPNFHPDPTHPVDYEAIKDMILNYPLTDGKVGIFVKDMALHCIDYLLQDVEFLCSVNHSFIIRDPYKVVASNFEMNDKVTCPEIGYEEQHTLFQRIHKQTGRYPVVVDADELQKAPGHVLMAYAQQMGLPAVACCENWDAKKKIEQWEVWREWHAVAAESSGIKPYSDNSKAKRVIDQHPHLKEYVQYHSKFYAALRVHAITAPKE